jgi:hypothetical protein
MPKLLKRHKAPEQEAGSGGDDAVPPEPMAEAQPEPVAAPPPDAAPPVAALEPAATGRGGSSPGGPGTLLRRIYGNPGEMSRDERDRQAAMEFEQAVAPVMDLLLASVPEASSPEEAARTWESRAGELRPDPEGGAYIPGDAYDTDARVYYRLLRRDYERNPRPSPRRGVTHHLHSQYKRFPGTKGW